MNRRVQVIIHTKKSSKGSGTTRDGLDSITCSIYCDFAILSIFIIFKITWEAPMTNELQLLLVFLVLKLLSTGHSEKLEASVQVSQSLWCVSERHNYSFASRSLRAM